MPSIIPYDPALSLGGIVSQQRLDQLMKISELQAPADAAEERLNSMISLKRSFDMTVQELINMQVDPSDVLAEAKQVGRQVSDAARNYAKVKIDSEKQIEPYRSKLALISENFETPVDYNRTHIKKMPLSADSLKMNVQYFAFDKNEERSKTSAASLAAFITSEAGFAGDSRARQLSASVTSQLHSQRSNHDIEGTLVISVTCTHKNAVLLAPLCIDVDKGIMVWNQIFKDALIKTNSEADLQRILALAETNAEKSMKILSGATYGSCFVGMVHILKQAKTRSSEEMRSIAAKMQQQTTFTLASLSSGSAMGVAIDAAKDAKTLLSSEDITSHCTLVTMGSIPSIKSNQVSYNLKSFLDNDGKKSMESLANFDAMNQSQQASIDASAQAARNLQSMVMLQTSKITAAISGLDKIDGEHNKMIDINSLMDALENYLSQCLQGEIGLPIAYFVKPITRSELAQMWLAKYFPKTSLSVADDDSSQAKKEGGDSGDSEASAAPGAAASGGEAPSESEPQASEDAPAASSDESPAS